MDEDVQKEAKRISNLKQNKGKTDEEILQKAKENLDRNEILSGLTFCLPAEREYASTLLGKYLSTSSFSNYAEKDTLSHLIDLEILLNRVKQTLNTEYGKANPTLPVAYITQVTDLTEQIVNLKTRLGLTKKEGEKNAASEWAILKEKAMAHYRESGGCNIVRCPECKKLYMILKDMKSCKETKLPWFRRTLLYNKKLFELYDQKILNTEQLAEIMGVSNDYVVHIYETEFKNEKKEL